MEWYQRSNVWAAIFLVVGLVGGIFWYTTRVPSPRAATPEAIEKAQKEAQQMIDRERHNR